MAGEALASSSGIGPAWVGDTLNAGGHWRLRSKMPYLIGLMMLFDSWDSIVIAFTLPSIAAEWKLTAIQSGWLLSAGYAGQLVGAIAAGSIAEIRGRLPVLRPLVIVMCVLAVLCGFAQEYGQLVALRLIQGLAIGGALPVAVCYINEIAPAATRGRFFNTYHFLMLSGFALASVASAFLVPTIGWRPLYWLGAAPLLLVPLLYGLPESPRWLAKHGRAEQARRALVRLGGEPPAELPAHVTSEPSAPRLPLSELYAKGPVRKVTAVMGTLWFLTAFVSFGLVNWVPSIYVSVFKISVAEALRYNVIVGFALLVIPLVLRQTVDRFGRRPPAILGTALGGLSLLSLAVVIGVGGASQQLLVTLTIIGQIGASIGSIILWPYTAEVFETRIRAMALGGASSLARGASMVTPLGVGAVLALSGSIIPVFVIFGTVSVIVALLWVFATVETAGKEIDR
ncbi:MAG: MFS transporter [Sphingomonas sp.]